ncbi:AMP-dependent synthetase [Gardnerella sp. KA01000]|uniref:AMP-dependent synthetase n=1 Tax=Gardnerella sp. KA01000 TaxID=2749080 RepID=UPI003BAC02D3
MYKNLYMRKEYWNSLYEAEKIRHIALSIIESHPDCKLTASTASALLGYQVSKDYDSEKNCYDNAFLSKKKNCVDARDTKIYIRSNKRKSNKYNNQLKVIPSVGYEQNGMSDDVRILTRENNSTGQLIKLPHASDCVTEEIKSHLVDKSTMLFDVANNYSFRFALPIFDSAARDNVNLNRVIEICKSRYCDCKNNLSGVDCNSEIANNKTCANSSLHKNQRHYTRDYAYLDDLRNYAKTNGGTNFSLSFKQIFECEQKKLAKLCKLCFFANGLSENAGESLARGTMINLGFMIPELQREFEIPHVNLKYRCDFLWSLNNGELIVGEFDGYSKYYIDTDDAQYKNVNLNSSEDNKNLFESRNQSVIHKNIDKQAEREVLLMKECGVNKIVRFNYSDILDPRKLEKKLAAVGVPRIIGK